MKVRVSITLERKLSKKIDFDRGTQNRSAYINELIKDGFKYQEEQK